MANQSGNAFALTLFCPIKQGVFAGGGESRLVDQSHAANVRDALHQFGRNENSPMAKVPNTYLCRFFILGDVLYEGKPAVFEQLQSQYLVFSSNFHGGRDDYLRGMWGAMEANIRKVWRHCVGFDSVEDDASFIRYVERCQVKTTFFFNGSTDESQANQLKALYVKQEFAKFAFANQNQPADALQQAFRGFVAAVKPEVVTGPTWRAGATSLETVVIPAASHGDNY